MSSGEFTQNDGAFRNSYGLRRHDLVGQFLLEDAILMDSGFMGKGVCPDNRLVGLNHHAGDLRNQTAGSINVSGDDLRMKTEQILPCAEGHDHLFEGGIPRPFTDSIDCALHLPGAILDGGEGVCNRQAEIIMAVDTESNLLHSLHSLSQGSDQFSKLGGDGVAYRVGDIDGCGPGLDDCIADSNEKFDIRSGRIHG